MPEVHPYLAGISEGRAVLDSVRAPQQIPGADASHVFAVWGHSQGGYAALYAGLLAKQYRQRRSSNSTPCIQIADMTSPA
jgi:acetyl esterase/lipase